MIVKLQDILKLDKREFSELPSTNYDRKLFLKNRIEETTKKIENGIVEEDWSESQIKTFNVGKKNHESLTWMVPNFDCSAGLFRRAKSEFSDYGETKQDQEH